MREARVGGPGDDRQTAVGEVPYQRLIHTSVGWIAQGVLVNGHEPLDVVGDVADGKTQYPTMHFNGQSTVSLDGDRATGESYCLAHHLKAGEDGQRTLMVASIRYLDEFVKLDGQWFFAERRLMVNWIDTRPSTA